MEHVQHHSSVRSANLPPAPHTAVYTYVSSTNVCPAFTAALLFQRKPAPPPPFPHFQCCGLGFVYLDHRQSEHDRILKVFQQPPPISLFVSRQFLSSPSRFMLLHLCPPADFWFELGKMSVLTHGPRMKLYCGDLINVLYVCPDQPLAFSNLFVKRNEKATVSLAEDLIKSFLCEITKDSDAPLKPSPQSVTTSPPARCCRCPLRRPRCRRVFPPLPNMWKVQQRSSFGRKTKPSVLLEGTKSGLNAMFSEACWIINHAMLLHWRLGIKTKI